VTSLRARYGVAMTIRRGFLKEPYQPGLEYQDSGSIGFKRGSDANAHEPITDTLHSHASATDGK